MASTDLEKVGQGIPPQSAATIVKYRSLGVQLLLFIVTIGLYGFYWFYSTATEMAQLEKREEPTVLWTLLLFVPMISIYAYFKYGELFERISPDSNRWLIMLLWFFFPPAVWILVQLKLNRIARG
jgi:hypothetical protein